MYRLLKCGQTCMFDSKGCDCSTQQQDGLRPAPCQQVTRTLLLCSAGLCRQGGLHRFEKAENLTL